MFRFCFNTAGSDDVVRISQGTYQLYLSYSIPCSKMAITNISIPITFYNINEFNNEFIIIDPDRLDPIICKLPEGNYNSTELLKTFKAILSKAKPELTDRLNKCVYNSITMKYDFYIEPINIDDEVCAIKFTSSAKFFGAEKNRIYPLNKIFTFPNVVNLQSISSIFLRSNLPNRFIHNNDSTNILFRLSVIGNSGSFLSYENPTTDQFFGVNNVTSVMIQLTDQEGREIDLMGGDFVVEFLCVP
jgi:hypothetical protein